MKNPITLMALILLIVSATFSVNAASEDSVHVRLIDRLDRPNDGYCFDILGVGETLRVDLPLFIHNCKPFATSDSTVIYTSKGQLVFPAPNVCVTAFGVNNTVLPGSSVLLRPCDERAAFYDTTDLQKFDHAKNGQLKLRGFDLCLTSGNKSSRTYSPDDRWRVLSLETCSSTSLSHSAWEMVSLKQK